MWYNIIENEMNKNFGKSNYIAPRHFVRDFIVKYFINLAFLDPKGVIKKKQRNTGEGSGEREYCRDG